MRPIDSIMGQVRFCTIKRPHRQQRIDRNFPRYIDANKSARVALVYMCPRKMDRAKSLMIEIFRNVLIIRHIMHESPRPRHNHHHPVGWPDGAANTEPLLSL